MENLHTICLSAICGSAAVVIALDLGGQLAEHPERFASNVTPQSVCAQYGERGTWRCTDVHPGRVVWSAEK